MRQHGAMEFSEPSVDLDKVRPGISENERWSTHYIKSILTLSYSVVMLGI
ncbi:MAG: hypothetical protein GY744_14840 [Gammaproteobacteria bacterium]|nr:hypothetical protein [Gammaproteobacteria bacterium]